MNVKARLLCAACLHVWEGAVDNPRRWGYAPEGSGTYLLCEVFRLFNRIGSGHVAAISSPVEARAACLGP